MSIAERIKLTLTMDEVARHYGFEPNRAGFIPCPFHHEKTASLKIYPESRGWYCFGCGSGGTIIDFVARLFNITARQAIVRLNNDFGLGLVAEKANPMEVDRLRRERREKEAERAKFEEEYQQKTDTYRRLWAAKLNKVPKDPNEPIDDEYIEACKELAKLDYYFETTTWR